MLISCSDEPFGHYIVKYYGRYDVSLCGGVNNPNVLKTNHGKFLLVVSFSAIAIISEIK